jgi:DNA-binding NarL/FixJ family response regulator
MLYERSGAPYETARARQDLAQALAAIGQRAGAEREARQALSAFQSLGAERDVARARAQIEQLAASNPKRDKARLTSRQLEVLRLVALGLSNPEIATRLSLSDHTVKRHIANLLTRLDLPSRAAAAAYAAQHGLL